LKAEKSTTWLFLKNLILPLRDGFLSLNSFLQVLKGMPEGIHVFITGRGAPKELIKAADLVTEMKEIKHPYKKKE